MRRALLTVVLVWASAAPSAAQGPAADWRTIETPRFRVHYPAETEAWARHTAARLEAIRDRLIEAIGYAPQPVTDVVVMDPTAVPAGMAIPLLSGPRIVIYTTAPGAATDVGPYRDWSELLAVHEDAHVVHLTRPSRRPLAGVLPRVILPVGPLAVGSPRWLIEGYATLLEDDLTGAGRPSSDMRAAILTRWAQRGRLPSYGRLSSDREQWRGMSMAYLAGSAFLEWLRDRRGAASFGHLWRRLSAREPRGFDAAFTGVFGEAPDVLYARFTAELTEQAMARERALGRARRDGELWQRLTWTTGAPAVSPDGAQIAVVLRDRRRPARLVVWSTGPPDEEARARHIEEMLARDPEDVAPATGTPVPRRPLSELPSVNGQEPMWPRWMPDGRSVLFVRAVPDADGIRHPDLFRWHPGSGRVERVTRRARLWWPDPAPDGTWAAAVRQRHGLSEVVRVDLADGSVEPLTGASPDTVYDRPRVSPDGRRLAYLRLRGGVWQLVVRDLAQAAETAIDTRTDGLVAYPAWGRDADTLYVALGRGGAIDLHAVAVGRDEAPRRMTQTGGAALAPEPSPDGRIFFLSLEPHGFDLRVLAPDAPRPPVSLSGPDRPPVEARAASVSAWETTALGPGRPYGVGRQELAVVPGGAFGPSARALELGLRSGDVIGRLNTLALVSLGRGGRGVAAGAAWRGWPVAIGAHVYLVDDEPSRQPVEVPGLGRALDARLRGVEGSARWTRLTAGHARADVSGGVRWGTIEPDAEASLPSRSFFAQAAYAARPSRGPWAWPYGVSGLVERGRTGDDAWRRVTAIAEGGLGHLGRSVGVRWRRTATRGDPGIFDLVRLGGLERSVLPASVLHGRAPAPGLPIGARLGTDHELQRVHLAAREVGPVLFYERHRVWMAGESPGDWLALVGIEADVRLPPLPLVRLPAPGIRAGVAHVLDAPFEGRTRFWLGLTWRP